MLKALFTKFEPQQVAPIQVYWEFYEKEQKSLQFQAFNGRRVFFGNVRS